MVGMSLLADASPTGKISGKRSLETVGGFNRHTLPSNFKHPKLDVRSLPKIYSSSAREFSSSNMKHSKVDNPNRSGINNGETKSCNQNQENPKLSDGTKYVQPILAMPLRCIAPEKETMNHEKLLPVHGKNGGTGKKLSYKNEKKVELSDEKWKSESEKLTALISQAKEFLNSFDSKYSTKSQEKRGNDGVSGNSGMTPISDENFSKERVEVDESMSSPVQDKKNLRSESKCQEVEEEVHILSHDEWQINFKCKNGDSQPLAEQKEVKFVDLVDEIISDTEIIETKSWDGSDCEYEREQDEYTDDHLAIVESCGAGVWPTASRKDETTQSELINFSIQHDRSDVDRVMDVLMQFEKHYSELLRRDIRDGKPTKAHFEAANCFKTKWIEPEKPFGHVPGIEIGDQFRFRAELRVVGLHNQHIGGIDHVTLNGKKYATSIVNSGRYENEARTGDVLIYSGQGDKAMDQKLERGNLALKNSMDAGYPVRVIFKTKSLVPANVSCVSTEASYVYIYDGLYTLNNFMQNRDQNGKLVYKFVLHRMPGQPRLHHGVANARKPSTKLLMSRNDICILGDVSYGNENICIRAVNKIDEDRPPSFVYTPNIIYPDWFQCVEPVGCGCVDGCSDSRRCPCVLKNGGEIPYNEKGYLIRAKPIVYECGPSCKCPPSCMNRVTQHGPKRELEIFKTENRGWGVRSRSYITSGTFICEYVGEFLRDTEAEQRVGDDEYLFDIGDGHDEDDGFAIDAKKFGNVGRFINHSCSPNLFAQEVLYDHEDKRMAHIMFFASRTIIPLQELTYDYNYKMGRVTDVDGNVRTKACCCGSDECKGRMY